MSYIKTFANLCVSIGLIISTIAVLAENDPSSKYKVLAKIFQSIRIEVNDELEVIKQLLFQASELLKIKGRIICISYHSLEDRLIKNFFRSGSFDNDDNRDFYGNVKKPFKKIGGLIVPDLDEIKKNKRARSAKMRIAEKI